MLSSQGVARILTLTLSCGLALGGMTACQTGESDKAEAVSEPVSADGESGAKSEEVKTDAPGDTASGEKTEKPAKKDKAKKAKKDKKKKK
jgi:hypothetical protein